MMQSAEIIAIVFRIINFGVIVALIAYLFKSRVLPIIRNRIQNQIDQSQALTVQQETLTKQHQQLLQNLASDEQAVINLKKRVDKWSQVIKQEFAEQQIQKERQCEYVQKQIERREFERVQSKALEVITRTAIEEVEQKMQNVLADQNKSQEYFAHLIKSLALRRK